MSPDSQQWFDFGAPAAAGEGAGTALAEASPPRGEPPVSPAPADAAGHGEVVLRRSPKATRYRLSVTRAGEAVLTMPERGSERRARQFLESQRDWLDRTRTRLATFPRSAAVWTIGTSVLFRGRWCPVERVPGATPHVGLGETSFRVRRFEGDLRPTLEAHFRRLARIELPPRTWELAAVTGVEVREVTVRNQRTRWGSCSWTGTISLNWRLVQAPSFVADYIVLHELMHRREMNHSERFWTHVEAVCPNWRDAERWLKNQGGALGL